MAATLEIRDLPECLEYRVTHQHKRWHLILRTAGWVFALILAPFLGQLGEEAPAVAKVLFGTGFFVIILIAAVNDIPRARRGTDVTFTVTHRDIISDGFTPNEYYPLNRWRLRAPDLSWKEQHSPTEEGPTYPQGVYCGNDCVLPLVTMDEGHQIVSAIYHRFPDTASESRYDDAPVPSPITTLGLSN